MKSFSVRIVYAVITSLLLRYLLYLIHVLWILYLSIVFLFNFEENIEVKCYWANSHETW